MAMLVYVAEPIDQARQPLNVVLEVEWADVVGQLSARHSIFRPRDAWRCNGDPDGRIDRLNRAVLAQADMVVAYLPAGVPSIGVPMEIQTAALLGMPVVVVTDVRSVALAAMDGVTVATTWPGVLESVARAELARAAGPPRDRRDLVLVTTDDRAAAEDWLPSRAHNDDAGFDLYTAETMVIEPGHFVDVPTTVTGVQLPGWAWGMITGRSSTLRKLGLHVPMAVIDPGWRGPLHVGVWNLGAEPVKVERGSRLGQLIVLENATARVAVAETDKLEPHERGLRGFGSTGQ